VPELYPEVRLVECNKRADRFLVDKFGLIGWGSNSGFQAVNLAIQFGASRIVLVGFDASLQHGVHWHGRHPSPLVNPGQAAVDRWRLLLDQQAPLLDRLGIEVVNASRHSALAAYPRMDLLEALK